MAIEVLHYDSGEQETFLPPSKHVACSASFTLTPITSISVDTPTNTNDVDPESKAFDPFTARQLKYPISRYDTWNHIVRSSLVLGPLTMPVAFKASGLWMGVFTISFVSIICTHCAHMLVTSAHALYKKSGKTSLSYADVVEEAFLRGPQWTRKCSFVARQIVLWSIFIIYYLAGSYYVNLGSRFFNIVAFNYLGLFDKWITTILLFLPVLIIAYMPNLKYLSIMSMIGNTCIVAGLGIICYYQFTDIRIPAISERPAFASIDTLPFCIIAEIYAVQVIGVIMPLENNMKSPQKIIGTFGLLNQGMTFVTIINIIVGFFGYLKYGEHTSDYISMLISAPYTMPTVQKHTVLILMGLTLIFSYGLVFYVSLDIFWNAIKHLHNTRQKTANYIMRTVLVIINLAIAIFMPDIGVFMALIEVLLSSILVLICPVIIEILTFWDEGFGKFYWKLIKYIVIVLTAIIFLIYGSKAAISLIEYYMY